MSERVSDQNRSKAVIIGVVHVLLAALGVYNLLTLGGYFIHDWRFLHAQGIGHLYLTIAAVLCCWWLGIAIAICFIANSFMPKVDEKITLKQCLVPFVGVGLSLVFPSLMVTAWFIVIVWIHSFF